MYVPTCHLPSLRYSTISDLTPSQAEPKLAQLKDDDGRLPIHWATSSNQLEIVSRLVEQKGFDPDVKVGEHISSPKTVAVCRGSMAPPGPANKDSSRTIVAGLLS
jgi:ankyrin repeat protein